MFFLEMFIFLFFSRSTIRQISPAPLSHISVVAVPSADTLRPAPAVAARLHAYGSEDSHRGPYQQA